MRRPAHADGISVGRVGAQDDQHSQQQDGDGTVSLQGTKDMVRQMVALQRDFLEWARG